MSGPVELYLIFLLCGLVLLGLELFLPGGIIGLFGLASILGAAITGFFAFGPKGGFLSAVCILTLGGIALLIWLKLFPRTGFGRRLTLATDGSDFKASTDEWKALLGREGLAHSDLRPSGIALIDGKRVDVVADSAFVAKGKRVVVAEVEGNRIVVRPVVGS